ncbi:MAG TPA: PAS domain S-box protein [Verrucomicrobiae bacterium]|nr:PAS domain S-box protein [Verrucomicrobiae bacterium]
MFRMMDRAPDLGTRDQAFQQPFWITASVLALAVGAGAAAFFIADASSIWRVPAFVLQSAAVGCLGILALRRQAALRSDRGPARGQVTDSPLLPPRAGKRPDVPDQPPAEPRRASRAAEGTAVFLWAEDAQGRTAFVNKALCDYRGVTAAEALKHHWDEGVHPEDLAANRATCEAAIARREPWRMEYRYRRHDGVYRWLLEVGQPQFAADGSYAGVVGSCVDISEHREIEATLRATEAELRQARQQLVDGIEGLTDGFALYDKEDRLVAWNSRYAELSGTDAVLLKRGVRFEDILRAHVKARREPTAIGREEEWIATRLAQHRDPKGSFERFINGRWYRFSDRPTTEGGIVTIFAQIDELKQREDRLRESQTILQSIIDNIPVTVSITDRDRRVVLLNRKIEELYGVKLEDVVGRPVAEVRPRRYASDTALQDHQQVVASGVPIQGREDKYVVEGGEETWITSVVPIKDDSGTVKFVLRTTIEVPQLAQAYKKLEDNQAFLIEAEKQARIACWYQSVEMGDRVFWSESVADVLGYPADQIGTTTDYLKILHPDDLERSIAHLAELRDNPQPYDVEYRVIRPDGNAIWLRSISKADFDGAGRFVRYIGLIQDITVQKAVEGALRESQEALLTAERRAKIACWTEVLTERGGFLASELAAEVLGIPVQNMAKNDEEYVRMIHPEDQERAKEAYRRAHAQHEPYAVEYRFRRKDGTYAWIRDLAEFEHGAEGEPIRMIGTIQDITDQKRIEEALRTSEARLQAFINNAPVLISIKDPQGRFLMLNPKIAQSFGLSVDEIVGKTTKEVFPFAGADQIYGMEQKVVATGQPVSGEVYLPTRLDLPWTHEVKFPIFDAEGRVAAVGGVAIDISARKTAELALAESEARFHSFMEHAPFDMYVKDLDGRYLLINRGAERSWGRRRDEILGRTVRDLSQSKGVEEVEAIEHEVLTTGEAVVREVHFTDLGAEWTHEIKFPIRDAAGHVTHVGGIAVDISDRKKAELALSESEGRLLRAQRQARLGYWSEEMESQEIQWSKGSGWVFGRPDTDLPAIEAAFFEYVHPDDRERIKRNYDRVRSGLDNYSIEYRLLHPDSGIIWVQELGKVERDSSGRRSTFVGTLQDVTERRALEEQLQQAQKMEAIGQLTGGIAHDFNNLLAIILGNLDLLNEQKELAFSMRRKIETAIKAGMRAADLTHRLLAFARRQALMPKLTEINELIRSMVPLLQRPLGPKIATTFMLDPNTWAAEIDQSQLEMALLNLTLNARDAMPDGGSLTIGTGNATTAQMLALTGNGQPTGDYVVISVTDTGTGMPDDVKARAFDPFFTTKGVGKGTGLGLSMVYGFVKQSGGHVQIESRLGEGTTVSLYLARATAAAVAEEAKDDQPLSSAQQEIVLLVEDEADVRVLAEAYLESFGYTVISAADGATAMAALAANPRIDLLLSDIILPGTMDGIAIAAQVRASRPEIKIVYMSGYAPDPEMLLPGTELIKKPFLRADLSRVVRAALDRQRAA